MQTDEKTCIVPNLWVDGSAREAVDFYLEALPDCHVTDVSHYPHEGLPPFQEAMAGQELTIEFTVAGQRLVAINAGAEFRPNPSISLMLNFDPSVDAQAQEHLHRVWQALGRGGTALAPLGETSFSRCFGWMQDRYGVCWQLILTDPRGAPRPFVLPSLLFAGPQRGSALQAIEYYVDVFRPRAEMAGRRRAAGVRGLSALRPVAHGRRRHRQCRLHLHRGRVSAGRLRRPDRDRPSLEAAVVVA